MALSALRGAVGFLSRLPVGHDENAWHAVTRTPATFPLVAYLLGAIVAIPLLAPLPPPTAGAGFVLWLYLVTGINHLDGVTDLGDAVVVHGDPERRRAVLADTTTGVGGTLALVVVVLGLAAAAVQLPQLPLAALGLVVVAEVGAKTAMALLVCLGTASHEGLGSSFTERASPRATVSVAVVAVPAVAVTWPHVLPAAVALVAAILVGAGLWAWARVHLGGVSGDVLGATNELARVVALHAGVIAWTLS